jgi:hypothetical protein
VRYQLKTPYCDGTTHIALEPLDLIARLAALVPPPRMHLTRFHGVFAPPLSLHTTVSGADTGSRIFFSRAPVVSDRTKSVVAPPEGGAACHAHRLCRLGDGKPIVHRLRLLHPLLSVTQARQRGAGRALNRLEQSLH